MANFNKVILLGNLTRDPQLSYTPNQTAVVEFCIATNRKWKGADGQQKEDTCFVDCRAFGKTAETINKYCQKGKQLMVDGRLTYDSWTAQDGSKRSRIRVTVENFQFIGAAGGGNSGGASGGSYNNQNQGGYNPPAQADNSQPAPSGPPPVSDDDIPF